jgi:hypothetical protein
MVSFTQSGSMIAPEGSAHKTVLWRGSIDGRHLDAADLRGG